jgi:hypothetical protein
MAVEKCYYCKHIIKEHEKAYIFKGNIACQKCDTKLRSDSKTIQPKSVSGGGTLKPKSAQPKKISSCFFCGGVSDEGSALSVSMCQSLVTHKIVGSDTLRTANIVAFGGAIGGLVSGPNEQVVYRKRGVMVPRCPSCKKVHESSKTHYSKCLHRGAGYGALAGLSATVSFLVFGIGYTGMRDIFSALFACVILGLVIGLLLGYIIAKVTAQPWPEGIKSENSGEDYPAVKHMLEYEWEVGEVPSSNHRAAQFLQLTQEGEKQTGIADVLDGRSAREKYNLFLIREPRMKL